MHTENALCTKAFFHAWCYSSLISSPVWSSVFGCAPASSYYSSWLLRLLLNYYFCFLYNSIATIVVYTPARLRNQVARFAALAMRVATWTRRCENLKRATARFAHNCKPRDLTGIMLLQIKLRIVSSHWHVNLPYSLW